MASAHVSIRVSHLQELDGFVRWDTEFAAERQLAAALGDLKADDHAGSGCEPRQLAHLRLAVDHKKVEAASVRFVDVRGDLDRGAKDHPLRRHAERQDSAHLVLGRDVEAMTLIAQELEHRLLGIGLDRIEDGRIQGRERLCDRLKIPLDLCEVE
jgi:hypothetical protein